MSKSFTDILNQIINDSKLHTSLLYNLSRLNEDMLDTFKRIWPTINVERRRLILKELFEIIEGNFEVNFNPIFIWVMADTDAEVRTTAIRALWEYEHPHLIRPLIHLLKTDEAIAVREAAATALGQFIYLRELEEMDWDEATLAEEALLEIIYQPNEHVDVRRRAIESIGFSSAPGITKIIGNAYYNENQKVRVSAIFAMGRNADIRWIPRIIAELENEEAEFRFEAARACGELEAQAAIDKLVALIEYDSDPEVQEMAIWALGQIGGDNARQVLELCVDNDNEVLAMAAEAALEELTLFGDSMLLYDFDEDNDNSDDDFLALHDDNLGGFSTENNIDGKSNKQDNNLT